MKLHLLALPHTVTRRDFSSCAFSQKVRLFSPMLRSQGFDVIHYGVEGAESGATEQVDVLTTAEHLRLLGAEAYHANPAQFVGDATSNDALYDTFNDRLLPLLRERLSPGDAICLPFGDAHVRAVKQIGPEVFKIETGIGYPRCVALNRVYESEAWRHYMLGKEGRMGSGWNTPRREWVVPNAYQLEEWPMGRDPDPTLVVYFGRLTEAKGCGILPILAKAHPHLRFVMCGQGDPAPYLGPPNLSYRAPLQGPERAAFLGSAAVAVFPSRMIDPFCGAHVEAMLCGTPVVTADYGVFPETVWHGNVGLRCRTERQFIDAIERARWLSRAAVRGYAHAKFSTEAVAPMYGRVFRELAGIA